MKKALRFLLFFHKGLETFSLHSSISLADLVREIKKSSYRFMKDHFSMYRIFPDWQVGYVAFTYEFIRKEGLVEYINNQESHHRRITFKKGLIRIIKGVWDYCATNEYQILHFTGIH